MRQNGSRRSEPASKRARVKGAITPGPEYKYSDIAAATYAGDTTGTVTCLNLIAEGDDDINRDGRQAFIVSAQIRGRVAPVDDTTLAQLVRVLLVWDNAARGALPTVADILTASTSQSFTLVDNTQRFSVLRDWHYVLGAVNNTATQAFAGSPTVHCINEYVKIGQTAQYNGTAAAITSIQNGSLLMVTIGDVATASAATVSVATRVRFLDA